MLRARIFRIRQCCRSKAALHSALPIRAASGRGITLRAGDDLATRAALRKPVLMTRRGRPPTAKVPKASASRGHQFFACGFETRVTTNGSRKRPGRYRADRDASTSFTVTLGPGRHGGPRPLAAPPAFAPAATWISQLPPLPTSRPAGNNAEVLAHHGFLDALVESRVARLWLRSSPQLHL